MTSRIFFAACFSVSILMGVLSFRAIFVGNRPLVSASSADFARIPMGQNRNKMITLINNGSHPLYIQKVSTSCGCTTADLSQRVLEPKHPVQLKINLDASMMPLGKTRKVVTIRFQGNEPNLVIPVQADVYPLLHITPSTINFGCVRTLKMKTAQIRVERLDGGPLPIKSISGSDEFCPSVNKVGPGYVSMMVTFKANCNPGMRQNEISIETGNPDLSTVTFPVQAQVVGHHVVTPEKINFGLVRGRKHIQLIITDDEAEIKSRLQLVSCPSALKIILSRQKNFYRLDAFCLSDKTSSVLDDQIVLRDNAFQGETVRIPVCAVLGK